MASRKPYPSDVSDEEWAFVAPYLALLREDAPQREHDLREVLNALRWIVRSLDGPLSVLGAVSRQEDLREYAHPHTRSRQPSAKAISMTLGSSCGSPTTSKAIGAPSVKSSLASRCPSWRPAVS